MIIKRQLTACTNLIFDFLDNHDIIKVETKGITNVNIFFLLYVLFIINEKISCWKIYNLRPDSAKSIQVHRDAMHQRKSMLPPPSHHQAILIYCRRSL